MCFQGFHSSTKLVLLVVILASTISKNTFKTRIHSSSLILSQIPSSFKVCLQFNITPSSHYHFVYPTVEYVTTYLGTAQRPMFSACKCKLLLEFSSFILVIIRHISKQITYFFSIVNSCQISDISTKYARC